MKRKIYDVLRHWKEMAQGEYALLIEGQRRVGKSYVVEAFAKAEYQSYILIDFNHVDKETLDIFDNYLPHLDQFFQLLQLKTGVRLHERQSLIVFDEVQCYPKARAAIKYLVQDGRYDYIETGSLVSIHKNSQGIVLPSEEHSIQMVPMDFEEFLWALGEDGLMEYIKECFAHKAPVGALHKKTAELLRLYMIVGGMPQAVAKYCETKDFDRVDETKRNILTLYRNDIHQYANSDAMRVVSIYDAVPGLLQRHEKKFRPTAVNPDARLRDYEAALTWLTEAKILNCCYNITAPNIGLRLNDERTTLKCYFSDTGLLISHAFDERGIASEEIYKKLLLGKLEINRGMLVENLVAQMLHAANHKLYFYSKYDGQDAENRMEIDFLIAKSKITSRHNISPIEVKSGKNLTLSSLKKCIAKFGPYLAQPCVLYDGDVKEVDNILYLPLYMAPLL